MVEKSRVNRFDRGELQKPVKMANGWLKVDGYVGRTGLLEYTNADGSQWTEYRPPDEAFRADVLDSFDCVPLTNGHPPTETRLLDSTNTRLYQVGTVSRPTQDGKFLRSTIMVTDAQAIKDIEAGRQELSQGYSCDLDCTPGEVDGRRYDAIQRNISGNHVALCDSARGGHEIRLRVDDHDSVVVKFKQDSGHKPTEPKNVLKIKIDGVEVEVSETAAQLIAKQSKATADQIAALSAAAEKTGARADSAEAEVKKLHIELAAAPAKALASLAARSALESAASKLGVTDFANKTDSQIRVEAVSNSGVKCDGKSDVYVEACFDMALAKVDVSPAAPKEPVTAKIDAVAKEDSLEDVQAKGRAMLRELCNPKK